MGSDSGKKDQPWQTSEFWDARFREENTPWDIGEASPSLASLEKSAELIPGSSVVVPGCGRGHDALYFARLGYQVSGVDFSHDATTDLRNQGRREELPLEVLNSSVWTIPTTWYGTFDVWAEHTFFCAIDPLDRQAYVEQTLNLIRPRGRLIGAFFINEKGKSSSINESKSGPPFWVAKEEFEQLFSPHYDFVRFEPSGTTHPSVGQPEWVVDLKRK